MIADNRKRLVADRGLQGVLRFDHHAGVVLGFCLQLLCTC